MLPITGCAVVVLINPSGPVHTVFTVTETFTAELNTTVQVRVTVDPTAIVLLLMVTVGVGTILYIEEYMTTCSVHVNH